MAPDLEPMLRRCDAALLIGDAALFLDAEAAGLRKIDLGAEWSSMTGCPSYGRSGRSRGMVRPDTLAALTAARDAGVAASDGSPTSTAGRSVPGWTSVFEGQYPVQAGRPRAGGIATILRAGAPARGGRRAAAHRVFLIGPEHATMTIADLGPGFTTAAGSTGSRRSSSICTPRRRPGPARRRDPARKHSGRVVTYIIDRNVNYTNICVARCNFCAFYRPVGSDEGYVLGFAEIFRKIDETIVARRWTAPSAGRHNPDSPLSSGTRNLSAASRPRPGVPLPTHCPRPR